MIAAGFCRAYTIFWILIAAMSRSFATGFASTSQNYKNGFDHSSCANPYFGKRIRKVSMAKSRLTAAIHANHGDMPTKTIGSIAFLIASENGSAAVSKFGASSPYGTPSIVEAVHQLSHKLYYYSNGTTNSEIVEIPQENKATAKNKLLAFDVLIAIGLRSEPDVAFASSIFEGRLNQISTLRRRQCQFALDCTPDFPAFVSTYDRLSFNIVAELLPWTYDATAKRLYEQMIELFGRWTSDDFCYAVMIFLNQFSGSQVDWVKHTIDATWEKGPIRNAQELYRMVNKCSDCIVKCLQDDNCRRCLSKLTEIDSRDQVSSYRAIVSFESDILKDFSQCILTRNNVFNCDAEIPSIPKVVPIQSFRGERITEELACGLLLGHLDHENSLKGSLKKDVSWIVACGANVAYDQFPSQNQIFYPASNGRDLWYDPVFRVNTLDGRSVWCKRHYRVRPQREPATFRFSVLDNGVMSDEFWTIVGAADDLSWIIFHYAGAAKAIGLQYLGGLLCTPTGSMPSESDRSQIMMLFRSAGIHLWELYQVDNRVDTPDAKKAGLPPLDYFRKGQKSNIT